MYYTYSSEASPATMNDDDETSMNTPSWVNFTTSEHLDFCDDNPSLFNSLLADDVYLGQPVSLNGQGTSTFPGRGSTFEYNTTIDGTTSPMSMQDFLSFISNYTPQAAMTGNRQPSMVLQNQILNNEIHNSQDGIVCLCPPSVPHNHTNHMNATQRGRRRRKYTRKEKDDFILFMSNSPGTMTVTEGAKLHGIHKRTAQRWWPKRRPGC